MAGDLNFRLNETDGEQVLREIVRGAEENDYSELLAKDQLTELIQNKSIFRTTRNHSFISRQLSNCRSAGTTSRRISPTWRECVPSTK